MARIIHNIWLIQLMDSSRVKGILMGTSTNRDSMFQVTGKQNRWHGDRSERPDEASPLTEPSILFVYFTRLINYTSPHHHHLLPPSPRCPDDDTNNIKSVGHLAPFLVNYSNPPAPPLKIFHVAKDNHLFPRTPDYVAAGERYGRCAVRGGWVTLTKYVELISCTDTNDTVCECTGNEEI
jgi:hypothetical protein